MLIDNVALLIPTHQPHYNLIYNLINKFKANEIFIDIFLVFSSQNDWNNFLLKDAINPLIITEPLKTNSIITFKKFFGLKKLINSKYEYIICCDSELDFIPENFSKENLNDKINKIFNNKKIYAGDTTGVWVNIISNISANVFPDKINELKKITNDFNLYFWWSDLPVYRKSDLIHFFDTFNYENIVWHHFDHLIYQYYLILFHDFKIIDTTPITNRKWSLEGLNTNDPLVLNKLLEIDYGFSWNNKSFYNIAKEYIIMNKGLFIYHVDSC